MSEDKKEFYKRQLNSDVTTLSLASIVLRNLAGRYDEKAEEIEGILTKLKEYQALLTVEGHMGYYPKEKVIETVDLVEVSSVEDATAGELIDAAEFAKELEAKRIAKEEALAERKRIADEKAKKKAELEAQLAALVEE